MGAVPNEKCGTQPMMFCMLSKSQLTLDLQTECPSGGPQPDNKAPSVKLPLIEVHKQSDALVGSKIYGCRGR